jgi:hypothetical protein
MYDRVLFQYAEHRYPNVSLRRELEVKRWFWLVHYFPKKLVSGTARHGPPFATSFWSRVMKWQETYL